MATREEMKATLVKLQAEVDNLKKQIETVPSSPDWVKEFLKGKWVVRCANTIEAASFLTTCKEAGITWCSGIKIDVEREKTRNDFHAYGAGIEYNAAYMIENNMLINFADLTPPASVKEKISFEDFLKGNIIIHCASKDEAKAFLTRCIDNGVRWHWMQDLISLNDINFCHRYDFVYCSDNGIEGGIVHSADLSIPGRVMVNFTNVVPPAPSMDKVIEDHVKALGSMVAMSLGGGLPNPTHTFEEFGRGLFCVNCATQEEVKTFYTWCSHFGLTWGDDSKVTPYDDRTRNRFVMDRMPGDVRRMFHNAMPETPTVNFSDIIPPIPPLPMFTFEDFLNREVCVNFQTEEERRTFWDWCQNADVNWKGKFTEDKWEMFRVNQRWVTRPSSLYNDDRKYLNYDACLDVPEVQFTQIIPPVKPEPVEVPDITEMTKAEAEIILTAVGLVLGDEMNPKPTLPYTLEGFLNGEFCVNFDSNEERGILFDMLYDRLDWSRFINPSRDSLRGLYQDVGRWCVERNAHKGTKELFTYADKRDFPVEVKFKDMTLFSADIFGAGNVAVCFDGDNKKKDLLYFFAWCRKHGFRFQPSWEYILNSTFIWKVGYIVMEDGHLRQGRRVTNYESSKYRRVNFSDIMLQMGPVTVGDMQELMAEKMGHTMKDFKNRKFCIVFDTDATDEHRMLLRDWCEANGINAHGLFEVSGLNRFVVNVIGGAVLFHSAKDEVPAVNFNEIKHLLGGR
jgi:hypothetical protein